MFNKELFDKICNVNCSPKELENFVIGIDKKEFDLDNPFSKYYNVEKIIRAIEKYQAHKIDAKFLAYWMDAYNWIIMGGFKIFNKNISLIEFLKLEICDWLDSLSFFDDSDDIYDLEKYKTTFRVLDKALKDGDDCNAVFSDDRSDEIHIENDDKLVLVTNDKAKYFLKFSTELDHADEKILLPKVSYDEMTNRVERLQQQGYTKLRYFQWEDGS